MNHEFITATAQMVQQIAKMLAAADAIQLWVQEPGDLNGSSNFSGGDSFMLLISAVG
jgi:hypothetical protein